MAIKYTESYYVRVLLNKVQLKEIMTSPPISVREDAPFSLVAEKIEGNRIRHLPIVDKDNKLVGIMSQRDLYKIQPPHKLEGGEWYYDKEMLDGIILRTVMTPNPFALKPDNTVGQAIIAMVNHKYGCIPVVDDKRTLLGIVTQIDILKMAVAILVE